MSSQHDHYLARMHLAGFSFDGKRLWQLDRRNNTLHEVGVRDAGVKRRLNTVKRNGVVDRSLERYIAAVNESPAGPLVAKLPKAPAGPIDLTSDERGTMAEYVALTYARSPAWRGQTPQRTNAAIAAMARRYEDPADFARQVASAGIRMDALAVEVTRLRYLVAFRRGEIPAGLEIDPWPITVKTAIEGRGRDVLASMTTFAIRREREPFMVCGDSAVLLMKDGAYFGHGQLGVGGPDVRVVTPISSEAFLVSTSLGGADAAQLLAP